MGKRYEVEATIKCVLDFTYEDDGSNFCIEDQILGEIQEQENYPTFSDVDEIVFDFVEIKESGG